MLSLILSIPPHHPLTISAAYKMMAISEINWNPIEIVKYIGMRV